MKKTQSIAMGIIVLAAAAGVGALAFTLLPRAHERMVVSVPLMPLSLESARGSGASVHGESTGPFPIKASGVPATRVNTGERAGAASLPVPEVMIAAAKQFFPLRDEVEPVTIKLDTASVRRGEEHASAPSIEAGTASVTEPDVSVKLPYSTREIL